MERREFLRLTLGFTVAAGAIVATAVSTARAAPMLPPAGNMVPPAAKDAPAAEPAIATQDDVDSMHPEQVQWGWRRRRYWRRRYWRRRYWGRRYWRRRYWARPYWRRRYWRRPRRVYYY